jgi:hypothetical protein
VIAKLVRLGVNGFQRQSVHVALCWRADMDMESVSSEFNSGVPTACRLIALFHSAYICSLLLRRSSLITARLP